MAKTIPAVPAAPALCRHKTFSKTCYSTLSHVCREMSATLCDVTIHQRLTSELYISVAVMMRIKAQVCCHSTWKNPWMKLGTWTTFQLWHTTTKTASQKTTLKPGHRATKSLNERHMMEREPLFHPWAALAGLRSTTQSTNTANKVGSPIPHNTQNTLTRTWQSFPSSKHKIILMNCIFSVVDPLAIIAYFLGFVCKCCSFCD